MGSMLFLALIIVVVSGLVAYIGDLVGRKMGRKRLTLLGMRPRYTAIIISVTVGMIIAALTLGATLLVSSRIREAFFTPISDLKAQLHSMAADRDRMQGEIGATRAERDTATAQLAAEQEKLLEAGNALRVSQGQRGRILADLSRARKELSTVQGTLQATQRRLDDANARLMEAKAEYAQAKKAFAEVQSELKRSTEALKRMATVQQQAEDELHALEANISDLTRQRDDLKNQVALLTEFARSSFAPLAFTSGQELVSAVLPTNTTDSERSTLLEGLLGAAETLVRRQSPEMPRDAAALIFLEGTENDLRPVQVSREQAVKILATRIDWLNDAPQVVVRLAPVNNVPINGPALIAVRMVELQPNVQVYAAGAEVARMQVTVTETTSRADLLGALVDDLIRMRVPDALRARKVLMLTRRIDPAHPQQVPDAAMPLVSWAELLAAADQASALRGSVTIVAKSRGAMRRSGPVELVFDVTAKK